MPVDMSRDKIFLMNILTIETVLIETYIFFPILDLVETVLIETYILLMNFFVFNLNLRHFATKYCIFRPLSQF